MVSTGHFSVLIFTDLSTGSVDHSVLEHCLPLASRTPLPWPPPNLLTSLLSLLCWIFLSTPISKYPKAPGLKPGPFYVHSLHYFVQSHGSTCYLCAIDSKFVIPVPTCPRLSSISTERSKKELLLKKCLRLNPQTCFYLSLHYLNK